MTKTVNRIAQTAAFLVLFVPLAAIGQVQPSVSGGAAVPGSADCLQIEKNLGISPDQCGVLSLSELVDMKRDAES